MQEDLPSILEARLTAGLQPIRQFVLAQALYHFMDMGIYEVIVGHDKTTVQDVAQKLNLHEERLRGLLQYLANEGFVDLTQDNTVRLTAAGREIADFRPWYTLLVGGYAQTFQQLPRTLQADGPYANRNSSRIGIGSCGISQYDALPMTRRLLDRVAGKWHTIVDLGCGDGSYLIDLCRSIPGIHGLGLDPEPASVQAASLAAKRYGISDRVDVRIGSATAIPDLSQEAGPLCFITAFVLQEILEQSGRAAVLNLLKTTFDRYPDSHWVVVEVDQRATDPTVMNTGLGLGYYNPYYLIHHLTEQRLESVAFWKQLFEEARLRVLAIEHPDSAYDSLELKVGLLLSRE